MLAQGGKRQGAQSPQAPRCRCCSDSARSSASNALLSAASSTSVPRLDSADGYTQGAQTPRAPATAHCHSHGVPQPAWYLCPDISMVGVRLGMACHPLTLPRVTASRVTSLLRLAHGHLDVCPGLCVPIVHGEQGVSPGRCAHTCTSVHTCECTLVCTRVHVPMSACPCMCPCACSPVPALRVHPPMCPCL